MGLVSFSKKPEVASTQSTLSPRVGDTVANVVSLRLTCAGREKPTRTHPPGTRSAMKSCWKRRNSDPKNIKTQKEIVKYVST